MSASSHRVIEIASLVGLVAGTLWLTAFAISGSVISILLIPGAIADFCGRERPLQKSFVLWAALFRFVYFKPDRRQAATLRSFEGKSVSNLLR